MKEIRATDVYRRWRTRLRDQQTRDLIDRRIRRLRRGLLGDVRPVGQGVSELRIHTGPGYRIYFTQHGDSVIILLAAGEKRSQSRDIRRAIELAQDI